MISISTVGLDFMYHEPKLAWWALDIILHAIRKLRERLLFKSLEDCVTVPLREGQKERKSVQNFSVHRVIMYIYTDPLIVLCTRSSLYLEQALKYPVFS